MSFHYIDPPFSFNAQKVASYPAEVTGYYLLQCMRRRFGWDSFAGKRILDFGCGVRFARTIFNLNLEIGLYFGVDVHQEAIGWLQANALDRRMAFAHLNARNTMYNPTGSNELGYDAVANFGGRDFDAACMFSVITHQSPEEAQLTFGQLRRVVSEGAQLYFTAFTDSTCNEYYEADPAAPGLMSTYHPDRLIELLEKGGWRVSQIHEKDDLQQTAFVCETA